MNLEIFTHSNFLQYQIIIYRVLNKIKKKDFLILQNFFITLPIVIQKLCSHTPKIKKIYLQLKEYIPLIYLAYSPVHQNLAVMFTNVPQNVWDWDNFG